MFRTLCSFIQNGCDAVSFHFLFCLCSYCPLWDVRGHFALGLCKQQNSSTLQSYSETWSTSQLWSWFSKQDGHCSVCVCMRVWACAFILYGQASVVVLIFTKSAGREERLTDRHPEVHLKQALIDYPASTQRSHSDAGGRSTRDSF